MSENPPTANNWQMAPECLATSGNITAAWHFGSTAKGRYQPGTDIDIGVLFAR